MQNIMIKQLYIIKYGNAIIIAVIKEKRKILKFIVDKSVS